MTFSLHPRRWDVSIFDLYSLAAEKHPIRMTAELMQIFMPNVRAPRFLTFSGCVEQVRRLEALMMPPEGSLVRYGAFGVLPVTRRFGDRPV